MESKLRSYIQKTAIDLISDKEMTKKRSDLLKDRLATLTLCLEFYISGLADAKGLVQNSPVEGGVIPENETEVVDGNNEF